MPASPRVKNPASFLRSCEHLLQENENNFRKGAIMEVLSVAKDHFFPFGDSTYARDVFKTYKGNQKNIQVLDRKLETQSMFVKMSQLFFF